MCGYLLEFLYAVAWSVFITKLDATVSLNSTAHVHDNSGSLHGDFLFLYIVNGLYLIE